MATRAAISGLPSAEAGDSAVRISLADRFAKRDACGSLMSIRPSPGSDFAISEFPIKFRSFISRRLNACAFGSKLESDARTTRASEVVGMPFDVVLKEFDGGDSFCQ